MYALRCALNQPLCVFWLTGLTFTPELYCAGVDLVGPSNIKSLFQSFPPYWKTITQKFIDRTGDITFCAAQVFPSL